MQALKITTIGLGLLILLGTTVLVVTIIRRSSAPAVRPDLALVLDEPAGTRIAGIAVVQDRLALQLQGGGADRVVLVDPRSGTVAGRISLAH